jgi:hypothetical protein
MGNIRPLTFLWSARQSSTYFYFVLHTFSVPLLPPPPQHCSYVHSYSDMLSFTCIRKAGSNFFNYIENVAARNGENVQHQPRAEAESRHQIVKFLQLRDAVMEA